MATASSLSSSNQQRPTEEEEQLQHKAYITTSTSCQGFSSAGGWHVNNNNNNNSLFSSDIMTFTGGSSSILLQNSSHTMNNSTMMDSSSIFSMDHLLHTSTNMSKEDEVLVDKPVDVLMDTPTDGNAKTPQQEETASVVSDHSSNGNNNDDDKKGRSLGRFRAFWRNGTLQTVVNGKQDEEEEEDVDKVEEEEGEEEPFETEPTESQDVSEENHHQEPSANDLVMEIFHDNDDDVLENENEPSESLSQKGSVMVRALVEACHKKFHVVSEMCHQSWAQVRARVPEISTGSLVSWSAAAASKFVMFLVLVCGVGLVWKGLSSYAEIRADAVTQMNTPKNDLRAFVLYEKSKHHSIHKNDEDIDELETDVYNAFARSACVKAPTVNATRDALVADLKGIPEAVAHDIVEMAVKEGITQMSSLQDSKADITNKGTAFSFMAFWSTAYRPTAEPHHVYETCVMVTGVTLTVAETVAEWTLKQEKYQVGVKPCYCGPISCAECPVFDTRIVKWPILERRSLSLKKQKELRKWMIQEAIQSAEHIIASSGDYHWAIDHGNRNSKDKKDGADADAVDASSKFTWNPMSSLSWTGPMAADFLGESATTDTSSGSANRGSMGETANSNMAEEL